jgi:hypothetical protein
MLNVGGVAPPMMSVPILSQSGNRFVFRIRPAVLAKTDRHEGPLS